METKQQWYFSTNKELDKIDNTTCGEIHTANEVIALICRGQKDKTKLISAAPDLLEALIKLVKKYEFNMNSTQRANIELDEEYIESINAINKATK